MSPHRTIAARGFRTLAWGLLVAGLSLCARPGPGFAAEPPKPPSVPEAERAARAEAIRQTAATIAQELKDHGGTWEAWSQQLQPFREGVKEATQGKWPWPAKRDFQFQGKEVQLHLLDDLNAQPANQRVTEAVVFFDRQLKARGIDLIFFPIPDKLAVYPDYLTDKAPADRMIWVAAKREIKELLEQDVEVLDLYTVYRDYRRQHGDAKLLYYDKDSHWLNLAAQVAGEKLGERLKRYDFVQKALAAGNPYTTKEQFRPDKPDTLRVVLDQKSGAVYKDVPSAPVVLCGDSCTIYNAQHAAGISAQVARNIGLPVSMLFKDGMVTTTPVEVAVEERRGFLANRRVLIWVFAGRFLGGTEWPRAYLPKPGPAQPEIPPTVAMGVVGDLTPPPPTDKPYPDYIMKFYLTELKDEKGQPVGSGDGVVHVLAMKQHQVLPVAKTKAGASLKLRVTSWASAAAQYGRTMTGVLGDVELEIEKWHYWGEVLPE